MNMAQNGTAGKELSSKQVKFVDALLSGVNLATAAQKAGISTRTSVRWKHDQVIERELREKRKAQFNETLDAFRAGLPAAMSLVLETIKNKDAPYSVRLRAAQIWIEQALEIHKIEELEARIADLEERYGKR